jgi:hypothetical protein
MYSACADHLKKTRTLVHDAKHRYQVFVLGPQEKLVDDGADVIEHALRICVPMTLSRTLICPSLPEWL